MIFKNEIIDQLSSELSLPFTGMEQDWDLEMANSNRVGDFLRFYKQKNLSREKKLAVMSLILASYDDLLNECDLEADDKWYEIKSILESERLLFDDLIDYWSFSTEAKENNVFRITPLIREIKATR